MTIHEEQERVQKAVNNTLSHVREDPWLAQRVLAKVNEKKPSVKKSSVSLALAVILILVLSAAALAVGLGLFGQLSQNYQDDERLSALEQKSESINLSMTTDDGITIELEQAYYEGSRIFISYRLSGAFYFSELHEGAPEGDIQWEEVTENFIASEQWESDSPELQRVYQWLDGRGQRWAKIHSASLHDGLFLEDGTYLDIIGGDDAVQEDGSIVGWKECEIPQERIADTLTFKAVLFRSCRILFQDETTLKTAVEKGENTDICFTLNHNENTVSLTGRKETAEYQAQAGLLCGAIDMKGTIHAIVPDAWYTAWKNWEDDHVDMIIDWYLYQNETLLCQTGTDSISLENGNGLAYDLILPRPDSLDGLKLIPVYSQSGEHVDEAILVEEAVK